MRYLFCFAKGCIHGRLTWSRGLAGLAQLLAAAGCAREG